MENKGEGVWVQLSTESMKKIHEEWLKRQKMSPEEKIKEMGDTISRGMKMIETALISLKQDANVEYINKL